MHPSRSMSVLALITTLGVAAALLFWGTKAWDETRRDTVAPIPADGDAEPIVAWPAENELALEEHEARRGDAATDRGERTASATDPPRQGPVVTVQRGSPPLPAAAVDVAWMGHDDALRARGASAGADTAGTDLFDLPARLGRKAPTAADGTLRLPPIVIPTLVAVVDGSDFAAAVVGPGVEQVRLLLATDETLRLRVVDEQGRPCAAVPVGVFLARDPHPLTVWRGSSDATGLATFRHLQVRRPAAEDGERFFAAVAVPQERPSVIELGLRPPPAEPVELVLRPTLPLRVRVVHRSGAPLLARVEVLLRPRQPLDREWQPRVGRAFDRLLGVTRPDGAPLVFPHVGLGIELQPHLRLPGKLGPRALPPWRTPMHSEGTVDLALVLPDDLSVIAARFADGDGTPLSDTAVQWMTHDGAGTVIQDDVRTLEDGRTDLLLAEKERDPSLPLTLTIRAVDAAGGILGTTVFLGTLRHGERRDLGQLRLQAAPLLVRGTVRDDLGAALAGARLTVQALRVAAGGEEWNDLPLLRTESAKDGSFAFFAAPPSVPFRVFATRSGGHCAGETAPLSAGAEVELRQARTGILRGKVLLPDWLPDATARLTLAPFEAAAQQGPSHAGTLLRHSEEGFTLGGLDPGSYTAVVTANGVPEPMATVAGLRIGPGENADPRLRPLDLRGSLHRFLLRAVDAAGRPLTDLEGPILCRRQATSSERRDRAFRWQHGRAELFAPEPRLTLITVAEGYARTSVTVEAGEHDVCLQAVAPFPIHVPGVRAAAGARRAIRVVATFAGASDLPPALPALDPRSGESHTFGRADLGLGGNASLDGADRASLLVSQGGPYEMSLVLYEGEEPRDGEASIPLGTTELRLDAPRSTPIVLTVDTGRLLAALRFLAPPPEREVPRRIGRQGR